MSVVSRAPRGEPDRKAGLDSAAEMAWQAGEDSSRGHPWGQMPVLKSWLCSCCPALVPCPRFWMPMLYTQGDGHIVSAQQVVPRSQSSTPTTPGRPRGYFFNPCSTYEKFSPFADTFKKRVSKNTFFVLVRVVDELW